jgi:predicted AAA+ superfamily ATPase
VDYAVKCKAFTFYLRWGAYPALTREGLSGEDRGEILDMYVRTFLERDIRDLEPFIKLRRYMANTTGFLVNYASVAKETGVSIPTVQRYLRYYGNELPGGAAAHMGGKSGEEAGEGAEAAFS